MLVERFVYIVLMPPIYLVIPMAPNKTQINLPMSTIDYTIMHWRELHPDTV